jgi:hypothetical protein
MKMGVQEAWEVRRALGGGRLLARLSLAGGGHGVDVLQQCVLYNVCESQIGFQVLGQL